MARPIKETVEYYPHYVKSGRTIFILENKFGNDGYAFWFKLLEILCDTDKHVFDCKNPSNWEFLLAKTKVTDDIANKIISTLVDLGKIDADLWGNKVIWIQSLVDRLSFFYERRSVGIPKKPQLLNTETIVDSSKCSQKPIKNDISVNKNPAIEENRIEKNIYPYQDIVELWNSTCVSLPKIQKLSDSRRQKIKCRLDEWSKDSGEWLSKARELFERIAASDFLRGDNNSGWMATFDWVFENSKNWVKVVEGNYDNNRGRGGERTKKTGNVNEIWE